MKRLEGAKPKDIEKLEAKLKKARAHLDQTRELGHVSSPSHAPCSDKVVCRTMLI